MLLIKCHCGCMFTVRDDVKPHNNSLQCQNCNDITPFSPYPEMPELVVVKISPEMTVQKIPDDAKINISFDV